MLPDIERKFDASADEAREWFSNEIAGLRTGRVTVNLVEAIPVEHYGARTPLNGLAAITGIDARTLQIAPWDETAIPAIEKALTDAQLGVNPSVDGKMIRLSFAMLTEEMREQTVKQLHKKAEETRVRLRQARDEALGATKRAKQDGDLTEDDMYAAKKDLGAKIDELNTAIDATVKTKEDDIRQI